MKKNNDVFEYSEMEIRTKKFYDNLGIDIKDTKLAVASLTMSQYAKNYEDIHKEKIDDQNALATVGDTVCGEYVMLKEYEPFTTKKIKKIKSQINI